VISAQGATDIGLDYQAVFQMNESGTRPPLGSKFRNRLLGSVRAACPVVRGELIYLKDFCGFDGGGGGGQGDYKSLR